MKADGVATNSIKVEAMIKWSTPSNITELTSFLGLTGYYKRFIKKTIELFVSLYSHLSNIKFLSGQKSNIWHSLLSRKR